MAIRAEGSSRSKVLACESNVSPGTAEKRLSEPEVQSDGRVGRRASRMTRQQGDKLAGEDNKSLGLWQQELDDEGDNVDNGEKMDPNDRQRPDEGDKKLEEMEEKWTGLRR
jgi:hypothetical protein